jgi:hypothetical protein
MYGNWLPVTQLFVTVSVMQESTFFAENFHAVIRTSVRIGIGIGIGRQISFLSHSQI